MARLAPSVVIYVASGFQSATTQTFVQRSLVGLQLAQPLRILFKVRGRARPARCPPLTTHCVPGRHAAQIIPMDLILTPTLLHGPLAGRLKDVAFAVYSRYRPAQVRAPAVAPLAHPVCELIRVDGRARLQSDLGRPGQAGTRTVFLPAVALPAPRPQRMPLRYSLQSTALGWERILHVGYSVSKLRCDVVRRSTACNVLHTLTRGACMRPTGCSGWVGLCDMDDRGELLEPSLATLPTTADHWKAYVRARP